MKTVKGKSVLVTGAAMGMGRMFAERALREGASHVILWDINEPVLKETVTALEAQSTTSRIHSNVVDVSDREGIATAAVQVLGEIGHLDVLVNNAGVVRGNKYFWETDSVHDTEFTMDINALAPMLVAREFLPGMIAQSGECRVVNLASAAGLTANPRMATYAASKWALVGWSDSVRLELKQAGHDHVKFTTVCPYYINTGMFEGARSAPLLPMLEPTDVVEETWEAMVKGHAFLVMPKTVMISEMFKGVMPVGIRDFVAGRVLGVYNTMDDFKGRPTSDD